MNRDQVWMICESIAMSTAIPSRKVQSESEISPYLASPTPPSRVSSRQVAPSLRKLQPHSVVATNRTEHICQSRRQVSGEITLRRTKLRYCQGVPTRREHLRNVRLIDTRRMHVGVSGRERCIEEVRPVNHRRLLKNSTSLGPRRRNRELGSPTLVEDDMTSPRPVCTALPRTIARAICSAWMSRVRPAGAGLTSKCRLKTLSRPPPTITLLICLITRAVGP